MGDIAQDIIDGFACSFCGQFFVEEHGFPVACEECFDSCDTAPGVQMATHPPITYAMGEGDEE